MANTGKRPSNSSRARRAIALLVVIASCLVAVLIVLPPRRDESASEFNQAGGPTRRRRPAPEQTEAPTTRQPAPAASTGAGRQERPLPRARVAVVIDDVGYNLGELQAFLDFPGPLTISVLPNLAYTEESARRITAAGKELLLHLPMEAENGNDPGPGAILTSQDEEQIRRLLDASFSQVPRAAGMNNHMGSRATADPRVMNIVMDFLNSNGHYFLDSRTTTETVGAETAGAHGVPYLERDIFLDNEPEPAEIRKALEEGIEVARKHGSAILIGHVSHPQIGEVIGGLLARLERAGAELVFLSDLLESETP